MTKKGKFFLHEEGGAMTERADHDGKTTSEGERLRAISREEARVVRSNPYYRGHHKAF